MGARCTESQETYEDDSSDFSAEIWPLRGGEHSQREGGASVRGHSTRSDPRSIQPRTRTSWPTWCVRSPDIPPRSRSAPPRDATSDHESSGRASKFSPEKSNPDPRSLPPHRPPSPSAGRRALLLHRGVARPPLGPHHEVPDALRTRGLQRRDGAHTNPNPRRFIPFIPTPT